MLAESQGAGAGHYFLSLPCSQAEITALRIASLCSQPPQARQAFAVASSSRQVNRAKHTGAVYRSLFPEPLCTEVTNTIAGFQDCPLSHGALEIGQALGIVSSSPLEPSVWAFLF